MNFLGASDLYELSGGAKTMALALGFGMLSVGYFMGGRAGALTKNYYIDTHVSMWRFFLGSATGVGCG